MATVYLSLGSNKGARAQYIARAVVALAEHGVNVIQKSSLYETEPIRNKFKEMVLKLCNRSRDKASPPATNAHAVGHRAFIRASEAGVARAALHRYGYSVV